MIEGQALSGQMFADLVTQYVQALNSEAVPTIQSAWERVVDAELRRVYESSIREFRRFLNAESDGRMPLDLEEFRQLERQARRAGLKALNSTTIANAPVEKVLELREAFVDKVDEEVDALWE